MSATGSIPEEALVVAEAEGLVTRRLSPLSISHEHVPMLIRAAANMISTTGSKAVQATHGFGVNDWRTLAAIAVQPGVRATELAGPLDLDKAALSRSIALLIDKGWVNWVHVGKRSRYLFLTPAGEQVYHELIPFAFERQELILSGFSEEERTLLVQLLYRLLANEPLLLEQLESLGTAADAADRDQR